MPRICLWFYECSSSRSSTLERCDALCWTKMMVTFHFRVRCTNRPYYNSFQYLLCPSSHLFYSGSPVATCSMAVQRPYFRRFIYLTVPNGKTFFCQGTFHRYVLNCDVDFELLQSIFFDRNVALQQNGYVVSMFIGLFWGFVNPPFPSAPACTWANAHLLIAITYLVLAYCNEKWQP